MAKQKFETMITPKGIAVYPRLNQPDTKFNADGEYKTKLRVGGADAQKMIEQINKVHQENVQKILKETKKKPKDASQPYAEVYDDEGNPTGEYEFNFKRKAKVRMKDGTTFDAQIQLVDAAKNPFPEDKAIWGGSEIRIIAELVPFATAIGAGVSLRLKAVQVLTLVEGSGGSAASMFDVEDGFTAPVSSTKDEDEEDDEDF